MIGEKLAIYQLGFLQGFAIHMNVISVIKKKNETLGTRIHIGRVSPELLFY